MDGQQHPHRSTRNTISRRALLRAIASVAGTAAGVGVLAACGGSNTSATPTQAPTSAVASPQVNPTSASSSTRPAGSTIAGTAAASSTSPTVAGGQSPATTGGQVKVLWAKPVILEPLFSNTGSDENAERAIFGTLVKMTDKLVPVPDLTENVVASPDAKTYTFTLRSGLKWTDGQPLTSRDVAFTIERAVDKRTGSFWRGRLLEIMGATEYGDQKADRITGVETPDDRTIKITLTDPDAAFVVTLGDYSGLGILPEHILKDVAPDQLQKHPYSANPNVTAGTFQFVQYAQDQYLELKRNDASPTKAKLDRVFMLILPVDTAIAQLDSGQLDVMGNVPTTELDQLKKNQQLTIVSVPSPSITRIAINNDKPYLKDKRIRQAMMYAIDRAGLIKEVLNGEAQIVNTPIIGPDWMGTIPGLNDYAYNPDKARQLLKDANWDTSRKLQYILTTDDKTAATFSPIVQQQFKDVGLQIDLLVLEGTEVTNRYLHTSDYELYTFGGGVFRADPDNAAKFFATKNIAPAGANGFRYSNPQVDALFDQGKMTTDTAKRRDSYIKIAQILNDEVPMVMLWSPNSIFAYNKRLQGFKPPGYAGNTLWNVEEWSVSS